MSEAITGVILAGGRGRRMDGADKGLQELAGRPLVQWVLAALAPQVDAVLISANRNLARYRAFGYPVLADRIADSAGPLAGLHAALAHAATPLLISAPCDSPFLPNDVARRLRAALRENSAEIAVARTGERVHRAVCLLRRELRPRLEAFLASGGRRLADWHASLRIVEVGFDDQPEAFGNINTPEDLARCAKAATGA